MPEMTEVEHQWQVEWHKMSRFDVPKLDFVCQPKVVGKNSVLKRSRITEMGHDTTILEYDLDLQILCSASCLVKNLPNF